MNPQIAFFLRILLLPVFATALYLESMGLSAPHYIGGMGLGEFFGFFIFLFYNVFLFALFWLYTRIFRFDDGNVKPDFLIHFLVCMIPLCYNYINMPPIEHIWHDGRDDYIISNGGFICVVILAGTMLFLSRLNTTKVLGVQYTNALISVFSVFYGIMHVYLIYCEDKAWEYRGSHAIAPEISKQCYDFFVSIHTLLPEQLQEVQYLLWSANARIYFEEDQVVIFLIAAILIPAIILLLHLLLHIPFDKHFKSVAPPAPQKADNQWVSLLNFTAGYTLVMPFLVYGAFMIHFWLGLGVLALSPIIFIFWKRALLRQTVCKVLSEDEGRKQETTFVGRFGRF